MSEYLYFNPQDSATADELAAFERNADAAAKARFESSRRFLTDAQRQQVREALMLRYGNYSMRKGFNNALYGGYATDDDLYGAYQSAIQDDGEDWYQGDAPFIIASGIVTGGAAAGAGLGAAGSGAVGGGFSGGLASGGDPRAIAQGAALGGAGGYVAGQLAPAGTAAGAGDMFGSMAPWEAGTAALGGSAGGATGGAAVGGTAPGTTGAFAAGGGDAALGQGINLQTPGPGLRISGTGLGLNPGYASGSLAPGYFAAESLYPVVGGATAGSLSGGLTGPGPGMPGVPGTQSQGGIYNGATTTGAGDMFGPGDVYDAGASTLTSPGLTMPSLPSFLTDPKVLGMAGGALLGSGLLGGGGEAKTIQTEEGLPDWLVPYAKQNLDRYTTELQNYQVDPYGVMPAAMTEFRNTLSGMYLDPSTNKYLEDYYRLGAERIKSSLSPSFGHMQAFGQHSGYNEALSRGLGDFAVGLYGGNYAKERDRQSTMTTAAPSFLGQASTAQFSPYQQYLATIGNLGKKKQEPYYTNPMGNIIGGGMMGYGLGKMFG